MDQAGQANGETTNGLTNGNSGKQKLSLSPDMVNPNGPDGGLQPPPGVSPSHSTPTPSRRRASVWQQRENQEGEQETGVQWKFVLDHLKYVVLSSRLRKDLFLFVPFLIMFVFFFLHGRGISDAYFTVQGMRDLMIGNEFPDIHVKKTFTDIAVASDWNAWVDGVVLLYLWDPNTPDRTYDYTTSEQMHYAVGQNLLLGQLRLRTLRTHKESCTVNPHLYPGGSDETSEAALSFPRDCYGAFDHKNQDDTGYGKLLHTDFDGKEYWMFNYTGPEASSGSATTGDVDRYPEGGYEVYINFTDSLRSAQRTVKDVIDYGFVDNIATRFVIVEFFVYTPQFNTFTSCKLFNEVTAGGAWIANTQLRIFKVWTSADVLKTVFDFFFFFFVLYYVYAFFRDFHAYYKREKRIGGFVTELWNFLEIVNLLVFIIVFCMKVVWLLRSVSLEVRIPFKGQYPGELEILLWLYSMQVYLNSVNTIITFLKLLKYVQLNEQLNILTETIKKSQQNIIGVLILFIFVVFGYAITGTTLFGTSMWDWRNLNTSFSTLLRMLLGDFDYPAMREENRFLAWLFFFSFVILGLFLLLNFIIAIIADAFAEVNGNKQASKPLDVQFVNAVKSNLKALRPKSLRARFGRMCKGRNKTDIIDEMWGLLNTKYVAHTKTMTDENDVMLFKSDIQQYVPEETLNALGKDVLEALWTEIETEWIEQESTSKEKERMEQIDSIKQGVEESMKKSTTMMEGIESRVGAIEVSLETIRKILEVRTEGTRRAAEVVSPAPQFPSPSPST
eukprot:TRINITY_DN67743_c10_g2_i1.p1 TRINITY_DN67743_c10_g2~~TRINITY_DN67743_c10_g2_i1.p1  ORF type:complete len:784 (-),score=92.18 TRINITY_DN67743_c10_g2_i1:838-3189(-)